MLSNPSLINILIAVISVVMVLTFFYINIHNRRKKQLRGIHNNLLFLLLFPFVVVGVLVFASTFVALFIGFLVFIVLIWLITSMLGKRY